MSPPGPGEALVAKLIYAIKDHPPREGFSLAIVAGLGGVSAYRWIHRVQGRKYGPRGDLLENSS